MYKHRCGAEVETVAAAYVHLLDCPLEERPAPREIDADVERIIGLRPRQRVSSEEIATRYRRA